MEMENSHFKNSQSFYVHLAILNKDSAFSKHLAVNHATLSPAVANKFTFSVLSANCSHANVDL